MSYLSPVAYIEDKRNRLPAGYRIKNTHTSCFSFISMQHISLIIYIFVIIINIIIINSNSIIIIINYNNKTASFSRNKPEINSIKIIHI